VVTTNKEVTMTAKQIFSRSLTGLSAIAALATGVAMTAAPSTARAETASQIIMSDGNVHCPPCGWLKAYNQGGLSFTDVVADVRDGQVVITAEVAVAATAGLPRMGSVTFSAFMNYSDDASFMDYTDDACMPVQMTRMASADACGAISQALRDTSSSGPIISEPAVPATGIIMRDGGICNPRWGC
jgi:hypothetical protein